MTWNPCPCCQDAAEPEHAILTVTDGATGDVLRMKVPHAARHDATGWGDRPRIKWTAEDGTELSGLEQARGAKGLTAVDHLGNVHRLDHGHYTEHGKKPEAKPTLPIPAAGSQWTPKTLAMRKASADVLTELRKATPLKPGQRWITVHPNGHDEKGVPVLVQAESDGTHRVIAGAGGKLTHLRHLQLKSPAEYEAEKKKKDVERREKEKTRQAAMTPEQKAGEKMAKGDIDTAKSMAERAFVKGVREKVGGVSEDLDEEKLAGLSKGTQNLILTRHHNKQIREATKQAHAAMHKLVDAKVADEIGSQALRRSVEENPVLAEEARAAVDDELHLANVEQEERKAERRQRQARVTSGESKVGERAAVAIADSIDNAPDPKVALGALGGRDDTGTDKQRELIRDTFDLKASEEVKRRSYQSQQDAKILLDAAKGKTPQDAAAKKVVEKAIQRAGIEPSDDEETKKEALLQEAARAQRRAEVQKARAKRFEDIEADPEQGGEEGAQRALAFADTAGNIAKGAAEARRLGLTSSAKAPLQEPEIAALLDVAKDADALRKARKEFSALVKEAEAGNFDRSRRAMDLTVSGSPEDVQLSIHEEVQRHLTERLLGLASRKRTEHLQALGTGHYDALADVGLGVAGQRFIDRPTVDALGVGNAAILMRHAMEAQGHDPKAVLSALEEHHVAQVDRLSTDAIEKADRYIPGLSTTVESAGDIETALQQLDAHHHDIGDTQRAVGSALGRLEATATLGQAFRRKLPAQLDVKTETGDLGGTLQWLHSIGLKPEDYAVDYKERTIGIPQRSWSKMVNPIPREEVERRQASNDIKAGKKDEPGWLPAGIVRRKASTFTAPTPEAPRYHVPLELGGGADVKGALADHVGSRLAEGEPPAEILHDVLAPVNVSAAPDPEAYQQHVRELFPLLSDEGKATKYEEHQGHFQKLAEDFMGKKYGSAAGAFHAQDIGVDDKATHEALFRALAEKPEATAAFAPTGSLTHSQARTLRDHFYKRMGYDADSRSDDAAFDRSIAELGPEPDPNRGTLSLFGAAGPSPEWQEWGHKRDAVLQKYPRAGLATAITAAKGDPEKIEAAKKAAAAQKTPWDQYVGTHGSLELAQRAMQDEIRSDFNQRFAEHHGKVTGRPLRLGVAEVTNRERHLRATDPAEAEKLRAHQLSVSAQLRGRVGGKFAAEGEGAIREKYTKHLEEETIQAQNQGSMFTAAQVAHGAPPSRTPGAGERWSLGERAESQIASLMPQVGAQFEPGKPVGLVPDLNMDGSRVHQQRVIRMREKNGGRLAAYLGTGSGKSITSIGAFTEAHDKGQAKHGLYLVPPAVQDQFGAEMLRFTDPGKYRWATGSGKSHEERVAMLQDPSLHMRVMTHQSFRETAVKLMAEHLGRTPEQMRADLEGASPAVRANWMREAFDKNGIPPHFVYLDEAHMATAREGQDPSGVHTVMQAATHPVNAPHGALFGTATPHKNDESEVYSMASMVDPERYADRHQFMQAFGQNLGHNPDAIRRELSHLTYSAKIDPEGVDRVDTDNPRIEGGGGMFGGPVRKVGHQGSLPLEPEHARMVDRVQELYDRARKARDRGQVDTEAMKELSPRKFENRPDAEHEQIARELAPSLGIVKESAMRRAVNRAPPELNTKLKALTGVVQHDLEAGTWRDRSGKEQKGKPSIIFTDSAKEAKMIHEHLASKGVRTALYHGGLDGKERENVRLGFNPEGGAPAKYDVVVATSAAEAGINMQRAKVIHHFDVPQTEKSHAQRSGRAYRQGQQGDVDVHNWHTTAEFEQSALRRLRRKGDLASVFQSPIANLDEHGIAGAYNRALARQQEGREVAS